MKNLDTANQIISDIAKNNKNITPVTIDDLPLFQSFFDKEPHTYGNSWTYVTQGVYGIGAHNLGYKYYDGKNLSMVCVYPKIEKPDLNVFYWIRPMGPSVLDGITDISGTILSEYSIPTYAKKLFKTQYDILLDRGFCNVEKFPWHSFSPEEDDTFPEQIFDIKKTLELSLTLSRKKHLRKSYARTLQLKEENNISINSVDFNNNAWNITKAFFQSGIIKQKRSFLSDQNDYYNMIFSNNNPYVIHEIITVNNSPMGYFVAEQQDKNYTSLYALIILRDRVKFLVDLLLLEILQKVKTPYLNLGGSEDQGIHEFKQKYYPGKEQKMYWATNYTA